MATASYTTASGTTTGFDGLLDAGDLVAAEIVEDDDVAGVQRRRHRLVDPGFECRAVDRPVEHAGVR